MAPPRRLAPSPPAGRTPIAPELVRALVERAGRPDFPRLQAQLRSSGYCARPVRLRGHVETCDGAGRRRVWSTDTEPDGVLRKQCGNRREAVCPPCAERYRGDAFQLIAAGLRGGKGVPDTVSGHPAVLATLTAPSFGAVHTRPVAPDGQPTRCRPRRDAETCEHGVRASCAAVHDENDACLGAPLCADCFDYQGALIWNNLVGELWRRTGSIYLPRILARQDGVTHKHLRELVRVAYIRSPNTSSADSCTYTWWRGSTARCRLPRRPAPPAGLPVHGGAARGRGARDRRRGQRARPGRARRRPRPLGRTARHPPTRPRRAARPRVIPGQVRDQEHRTGRRAAAPNRPRRRRHGAGARARPRLPAPRVRARRARPRRRCQPGRRGAPVAPIGPTAETPDNANALAWRAYRTMSTDERVTVRLHDHAGEHTGRIRSRTSAPPTGPALDAADADETRARDAGPRLTLDSGVVIELAQVAVIATSTHLPGRAERDTRDRRLAVCAHAFGYRGHYLTKSRRYSSTFKALREAREQHVHEQILARSRDAAQRALAETAAHERIASFRYAGRGHLTTADAYLAASAAARAREHRRVAWEEHRFSRAWDLSTDWSERWDVGRPGVEPVKGAGAGE